MLDNKQCEAFLAVVETGSFDQAGKKLCITPSAVTLRLQALEKELGQLLIIRGKPCNLTTSGQQVFEYLQKNMRLEQNLLHNLMGKSQSDFFKIIIASNADALRLAPAVIFNQKDLLHFDLLVKEFGLPKGSYPFHLIPSSESFVTAIRLGIGYGMVPEFQLNIHHNQNELIDLFPELERKVFLYWHHWSHQPDALKNITNHIIRHSKEVLR